MAQYGVDRQYVSPDHITSMLLDSNSGRAVRPNSDSPGSSISAYSPRASLTSEEPYFNDLDGLDEESPSHGPQAVSDIRSVRERQKRSRVTAEQLALLEPIFAADPNPSIDRRREISDMLGMQERQTQIWFQNRRAKAKLKATKAQRKSMSIEMASPKTPPALSVATEVDLYGLIHEGTAVSFISCQTLTIGAWRRIANPDVKHDLVAYSSDLKRCLTWYICSRGFGFKMEIPFDTIVQTAFENVSPEYGVATFYLSETPIFYHEVFAENMSHGKAVRCWSRCGDWTEGHQASLVLQHTLAGPTAQLAPFLRNLSLLIRGPNSSVSPQTHGHSQQDTSLPGAENRREFFTISEEQPLISSPCLPTSRHSHLGLDDHIVHGTATLLSLPLHTFDNTPLIQNIPDNNGIRQPRPRISINTGQLPFNTGQLPYFSSHDAYPGPVDTEKPLAEGSDTNAHCQTIPQTYTLQPNAYPYYGHSSPIRTQYVAALRPSASVSFTHPTSPDNIPFNYPHSTYNSPS